MQAPLIQLAGAAGFLVLFYWKDLYWATAALMGSSLLEMLYYRLASNKIPLRLQLTTGLLLTFGGLTLLFRNPIFLQAKPSLLYSLFALILWVGLRYFNQNFLQNIVHSVWPRFSLEPWVWEKLTLWWVFFFCFKALLNGLVVLCSDLDTWVYFKIFGNTSLLVLFLLFQITYLKRNGFVTESLSTED